MIAYRWAASPPPEGAHHQEIVLAATTWSHVDLISRTIIITTSSSATRFSGSKVVRHVCEPPVFQPISVIFFLFSTISPPRHTRDPLCRLTSARTCQPARSERSRGVIAAFKMSVHPEMDDMRWMRARVMATIGRRTAKIPVASIAESPSRPGSVSPR